MRCLAVLLLAWAAFAQNPLPGPPGPGSNLPLFELKQFLELTDAQYAQIMQNIAVYQRTLSSYQERVIELRRDIAVETAREHPSATELGTRYVEVEINCRLMNEEGDKLRSLNQALLTAAQKTKLQALVEALKLIPTASQAQQAFLLESGPVTGNIIPSSQIVAIRTGSFTSGMLLFPSQSIGVCGASGSYIFPPAPATDREQLSASERTLFR